MTQYRITDEQAERFWSRVEPFAAMSACWLWTGRKRRGYGEFLYSEGGVKRYVGAHRVSYELLVGSIPTGLVIDHLCRNPACVNPDHLEPVTTMVNIQRGKGGRGMNFGAGNVQLCPVGHEVTGTNAMPQKYRRRPRCRECFRRQYAEFMERNAA